MIQASHAACSAAVSEAPDRSGRLLGGSANYYLEGQGT